MSADLQWQILRNNSSFLLKRGRTTFTTEPYNLTGRSSFNNCGLINKRAVAVDAATNKGVVLRIARPKAVNKPGQRFTSTTMRKNNRRIIRSIRQNMTRQHYRADLTDAAVRRACAIVRSQTAKPSSTGSKRRSKKN